MGGKQIMARDILYVVFGAVLLSGCVHVHETKHIHQAPAGTAIQEPERLLRHVVLLKFKEGTSAEQVRGIEQAFASLPGKISAIRDLEWGTDVSVENRSEGFTHCFIVTFVGEAERAAYLPHPAHKEFGSLLGPHLDKVLVVDYWTRR
ncbi:MAG: Dabb family protein [Phycisphaerales bacterium]|nr:MAG: Dabb family protein [Phycisphaerales bacterium]